MHSTYVCESLHALRIIPTPQEIVSYLKGSAEALHSPDGKLCKDAYLRIGRKRAMNFKCEGRETLVWPVFKKYEHAKRAARRYDVMDLIANVYRQVEADGYTGAELPLFLQLLLW